MMHETVSWVYATDIMEKKTPVKKCQEKTHQNDADTIAFPYGSKDIIRYMVMVKDGAPEIYYRRANTRQNCTWIQIELSPIALRTRARIKLDGPG